MWFDPYARLAEIAGQTPATPATQDQPAPPVSQHPKLKEEQQGGFWRKARVANVATVATPPPSARPDETDTAPYGESPGGRVVTWVGRVVSLDAWRTLTEWERHGPNGRQWCGITRRWKER